MMTEELSAEDAADLDDSVSVDGNRADRVTLGELLDAQALVPERTLLGRIFGLSPLSPDTQPLFRAVVGEVEVGKALDRLGPDWVVLHGLPFGDRPLRAGASSIDHLVIGPSGVFLVATKNHSGQDVWASERAFLSGGVRYPHIRAMEHDLGRAERILSIAAGRPVQISGVLAIVAAKKLEVTDKHRDVEVVQATHLVPWLARRKHALAPSEITQIAAAAERAFTRDRGGSAESLDERQRFDLLKTETRVAFRRQLIWVIGVSAVMVGAFIFITYSILMNALATFAAQ